MLQILNPDASKLLRSRVEPTMLRQGEYMTEESILEQIRANSEERIPCVLIVDTSHSMTSNNAIDEVNSAIQQFADELKADSRTRDRAMLLLIKVGGNVEVVGDWCDANQFNPPKFVAEGGTPLGAAAVLALEQIDRIKAILRNDGNTLKRPWIFILTDGAATDEWQVAAKACREAENAKKVLVYPFGTSAAEFDQLRNFSNNGAFQIKGASFAEVFKFLSGSMAAAADRGNGKSLEIPLAKGIFLIPPD